MASLGNEGASALVKSAASIASQVDDYNDKVAAMQWSSSAQTDADWATYQNYLNGRISDLDSEGSLSSASKALTLTSTLQSAYSSYVSNSIQRQSEAIIEGTGSNIDKQNAIVNFYNQAVANGDDNLAQNLRGQYDTLNQEIQYQQQTADTASQTLAKANNSAQAQGYSDAASMYEQTLAGLGKEIQEGGQGELTKDLQSFVTQNAASFKALGVTIPTGAAATNGALIQGLMNAQAAAYYQASQIDAVTDPESSDNYLNEATNIINGTKEFSVAGATMNINDAAYYASNPNAYFQKTTGVDVEGQPKYELAQAAVLGYQYDQNGNVVPIHGPNDQTTYDNLSTDDQTQVKTDLQNAGFTVKIVNGQVMATASTNSSNSFFNNATSGYGISKETQYIVQKTATGYQFAPINDSNGDTHLLTLSKDTNGKFGLYQQNFDPITKTQTYNLIGSDNGFNAIQNTVATNDPASSLSGALAKTFANGANLSTQGIQSTIPNIAKEYFNGNVALATSAVNSYVQPLQYAAANPKSVQSAGIVPANAASQSIAQNTAQILGVPLIGPNVQKAAPTVVPLTKTTTTAAPAPAPLKQTTATVAEQNIAGSGMLKLPGSVGL